MGAESLWEPHTPVRPAPPPPPPPRTSAGIASARAPAGSGGRSPWPGSPCSLLFIGGLGLVYLASERLGDNVARVQNAFGGLDEAQRPPPTGALTFLLVGTDSPIRDRRPPGVNADGLELRERRRDGRPRRTGPEERDRRLDPPRQPGRHPRPRRGRVSGAYAAGGPSLLIQTVERLTALRIDHFAVIDFAGFRSMVDARGRHRRRRPAPVGGFARGPNHMDGAQALGYVRDRTGFATGDRARRQQNALRAILEKAASSDTLIDPVRLYDFLDAASHAVGVDDTLSNGGMRALALKLSDLRPADVLFLRAPVAAVGQRRRRHVHAARRRPRDRSCGRPCSRERRATTSSRTPGMRSGP